MRHNTLAIAIASLLIGGVATAAYMNNRTEAPEAVAAEADDAVLPVTDAMIRDDQSDDRLPIEGRLEYADVIAVQPVTRNERLYAAVIGTEPVRETTATQTPREVCADVVIEERQPERDGNIGGTVAGAVIGGLVGNQIGDGNGRKAATVAGAAAGGYIGNRMDKRHQGGKVVTRNDRQCRTVYEAGSSTRTVAWNVTYRNPDGTTDTMRTDQKPGKRIALGTEKMVVGYDVTYRYEGRDHEVRMTQKPGRRLPVVEGQVVTETAMGRVPQRG
ncbi:MAG: glycine zipper 2TM domain-containing protein [Lysobacteraceae bacterium]|nr:MAG: glycine zipper 2TM domain-containing protein [Xanthomonadaceae bacterium]